MHIMFVLGSTNPNGKTASAVNAFLQGVVDAGGSGEQVYLPKMNIERCRQCGDKSNGLCFSEGRCIMEDDFADIAARIRKADAVVFATPVFFADLSESMKCFLDRLRRVCIHDNGKAGIEGKPTMGICVAGGSGWGYAMCASTLENVLSTCGLDVADVVTSRIQHLEMKHDVLRIEGKWFAMPKKA